MEKKSRITNPLDKDFIRLLTDFGFKRIFGSKEHSAVLLRFLNALFEGEMRITSVEFQDKELQPTHLNGKKVVFDIYCTTDTGHHFILEMQQEESENFTKRILFYGSKAIVEQGLRGVEYELDPVICVVITNFNLSGMSRSLVKDIMLMDRKTHETYSDSLRYIFCSLKELPAEWEECDTELKRILFLIKNMEDMTKDSKAYRSGEYEDMFTAAATGNLSKEEAVAYSESYFKELDNQSAVRFAAHSNYEKGIREGVRKTAQKLKKLGIAIKDICEATGLNKSEIEAL